MEDYEREYKRDYKKDYENIKQHLSEHGVEVDEVNLWQGGFRHEGHNHDCPILVRTITNGVSETYAVPSYALTLKDDRLPYVKIY